MFQGSVLKRVDIDSVRIRIDNEQEWYHAHIYLPEQGFLSMVGGHSIGMTAFSALLIEGLEVMSGMESGPVVLLVCEVLDRSCILTLDLFPIELTISLGKTDATLIK